MRGKLLGRRTIKALKMIARVDVSDGFPMRRSLMDRQSIVGHIRGDLNASHPGYGRCLTVFKEVGVTK